MPIYEYLCDACGHKLEVMQRMSDERLVICPACSKESLRKLVSAAGFQLKGTGWYETDFKNKGKAPQSKSASGDTGASSGSSSESSGDTTKSTDSTPKKADSAASSD